jgi:hypothetical protein
MRSEDGKLLIQALLPAGRASQRGGIIGAAQQLFEFRAAIGATIFVDRQN